MNPKHIILASASPRRKVILQKAGIDFTVEESLYTEPLHTNEDPHEFVKHLAYQKALAVAQKHRHAIVIGADTTIVCEGIVCEKPGTPEKAIEMLQLLSGKKHAVLTGYAVIDGTTGTSVVNVDTSYVWFKKLTEHDIQWYIQTGEPLDKAGAYAIQELGGKFVEKFEGDYDNIVGLPVKKVVEIIKKFLQIARDQ